MLLFIGQIMPFLGANLCCKRQIYQRTSSFGSRPPVLIQTFSQITTCSLQTVKSKIGEVFFCSACYDKAADEEVTLSCRLLAQREEDIHTSAVAHVLCRRLMALPLLFSVK